MTGCGSECPAVFVVDSQAALPPLPPRPGRKQAQRGRSPAQTMLFLLVAVALCCVAVEACFIYRLYATQQNANQNHEGPRTEARKGGPEKDGDIIPKTRQHTVMKPAKPLAHLTAGSERPDSKGVMRWATSDPEVHDIEYREGALVISREGFYYVYSKLCFSLDRDMFDYTVMKNSSRYMGDPIELLRYRVYEFKPTKKGSQGSGYLGGVFHLLKDDALFVQLRNRTALRLQNAADNFFGMFML
ncbi:tumor necrosis factor ligand superfamily member 14 [Brachyhypopomus gauderio]|uniref:tumor necrosis factor ligand superfamily member 14 n=1 Tax=Brachyhypopomus gauderio TaxID=698409 RepID=UPI0040435B5B